MAVPNIFSLFTAVSLYTKKCTSSQCTYTKQIVTDNWGLWVIRELWVFYMELNLCHPAVTWNLMVAHRFLGFPTRHPPLPHKTNVISPVPEDCCLMSINCSMWIWFVVIHQCYFVFERFLMSCNPKYPPSAYKMCSNSYVYISEPGQTSQINTIIKIILIHLVTRIVTSSFSHKQQTIMRSSQTVR